jgi:hypothetical protein
MRSWHAHKSLLGRDHTQYRSTGTVLAYDPKFRTYQVRITNLGERTCQAIRYGADTAYPVGSTVVLGTLPGVDWVIEGEISGLSARTGIRAAEFEEAKFDQLADVTGQLAVPAANNRRSYRQVDAAERAEQVLYEGDVLIQNRTDKHSDRSFLKLFRSGNFVAKIAPNCFIFLERLSRTITTKAVNLIRRTGAYEEYIQTSTSASVYGKATRRQLIRSDARNPDQVDKESIEGYVPASLTAGTTLRDGYIARRGQRIDFESLSLEVDNDTGTVRISQGGETDVSIQLGSFAAENGAHPKSGLTNPEGPVDASNGLHIRVGDTDILATTVGTKITRGSQTFELTDSGLSADVANFSVKASGKVNIEGSAMTLKAGSINFEQ